MRSRVARVAVAGVLLAGLAACSERLTNIPNYNAPTVEGLSSEAAGIQLAATGILIAERNNLPGFVEDVGIFGREGYDYFTTDSRSASDFLIGQTGPSGGRQLDPAGFASGLWFQYYQNMRNEYTFLKTVDASKVLTAPQKSAAKGFAETFRALDLYYVIVTRDSLGAPVELIDDVNKPQPFVSRDSVWKTISALLDQAKTDLQAGGTEFPFRLTSGFTGFDTPQTFLKFNRALAARVYANRGSLDCGTSCYQQALAALQESFLTVPSSQSDTAALDIGVYNVFSASAGDRLNAENFTVDPNQVAHAEFADSVQKRADGTPDLRLSKIQPLAAPKQAPGSGNGIPAIYSYNVYPTTTAPMAIIRNEELLLIRAEAEIQTGALASALNDINTVRTVSGGLAPLTTLGTDPIGVLLKERWYSLLLEGHRWNDYRRFGRLDALPLDIPTGTKAHFVARVMPIPLSECQARTGDELPKVGC